MAIKVLFILPHSVKIGPSQRYRVGLFLPELDEAGIKYKLASFFTEEDEKTLYVAGNFLKKLGIVFWGYIRRMYTIFFTAWKYDYVFIQRGTTPVGPPFFEWLMSKVFRKKLIYDFDDAIWIPNTSKENKVAGWFKAFWKVKYICKWSYKVVGGNDFLCDYARKYNAKVIKIPTCVDTERNHFGLKQHTNNRSITVGWTGSHTTLVYLEDIKDVLIELENELNINFKIICNKPLVNWPLRNLSFTNWSGDTETKDLLELDIGIMPLRDNNWSEGKCGFKLIQYMSLGIPAVASPAGVNKIIIEQGVNGFLCVTKNEWKQAIKKLVLDIDLRVNMGKAGKEKVINEYSIRANSSNFIKLFS